MSRPIPQAVFDRDAVIQEQPLPALLVGFFDPAGNLVSVSEEPDSRLAFCRHYNAFAAECKSQLVARPIATLAEGTVANA